MGFSEYMKSLPYPRCKAVEALAEKCKVSNNSVYRWIQGKSKPNALCRGIVAEYLGMQESELFRRSKYGVSRVLQYTRR